MRKHLLDLVLGGNRRVEFLRLLVLGGYLLESYSPLAQPRLIVNSFMVLMQISLTPHECIQTLDISACTLNLDTGDSQLIKNIICALRAHSGKARSTLINPIRLNTTVRNIRTDNGTEFVNQTLKSYYEDLGISHQTSVARTPQQNEAVATTCYTQNQSLIHKHHNKTPYELLHDRKPDLKYLHVFGDLCYSTTDSEDLGKLKPKADIGIFIGYAPGKKAY
ncbi:retrovirus-related pol polyprotein from transposon TNT 1-94 [Tanacetum coccineum]